jgi:hypothetical protein
MSETQMRARRGPRTARAPRCLRGFASSGEEREGRSSGRPTSEFVAPGRAEHHFGPISPPHRRRLRRVLVNPTAETWADSYAQRGG